MSMKKRSKHWGDKMVVGYTTGVFDMFHIGHLNLLRRAKAECDYLIVGVSTDELVLREKGKLPIIPFEERAEIIKAIRYVDEVIVQKNKDKLSAYLGMEKRFNKMLVGDDWKGTPQWEKYEDEFRPYGVEIVYLTYTKGISSSILRKKIVE